MNTFAYVLILLGLWLIRGIVKGRGITDQWQDAGDMFVAFVRADSEAMAEVMARTGDGLDFEPVSGPSGGSSATGKGGTFGTIVDLGKYAQAQGLSVREHPAFDPVDPVHTKGSDHYKNKTGTGADAIDVSGQETALVAFAKTAQDSGFYVLFNRPGFTNWPGHDTHVHVSDRR